MNELKLRVGVVCRTFEEWKLFTSSGIFEPIAISEREAIETDLTRYSRISLTHSSKGTRLDQIILINMSVEEFYEITGDAIGSCLANSTVPTEFQHILLTL
jgi:hypothetical protein